MLIKRCGYVYEKEKNIVRKLLHTRIVVFLEHYLPPKFVAKPLINYFRLFPSLPIHRSFSCWHLSCLIFFDVAHYHQK